MAAKSALDQNAKFVFAGVVKSAAPAGGENTAVVTVEQVLRGPQALADAAGSDVLVSLQPGEKLAKGDHATFYSNPIRWGDQVTVTSGGFVPAVPPADSGVSRRRGSAAPPPVKNLADQHLEEQVAKADVVVSGTVSAVTLPDTPAAPQALRRAGAGAASPAPRRISEHDPMWRDAVINVKSAIKGQPGKQIKVRFPKSNDVIWKDAPKFKTGQEGVFLLHQEQLEPPVAAARGARRAAGAAAPSRPAYVALTPTDFQPLDREESIRSLIRGAKA